MPDWKIRTGLPVGSLYCSASRRSVNASLPAGVKISDCPITSMGR
jgi:hypothetical protein